MRIDSIILAAELPFFLHATGRQQQADKLAKTMATKKLQDRGIHWNAELCIHMLTQQGKSSGEIVEFIYDHLNLYYHYEKVLKIRKKNIINT